MKVSDLKESNDFLNILFENVTSAIFIVDKQVRIKNFNNSFAALFKKSEDKILGELCGNAIGCSFAVDESKDCGTTSNCHQCNLRNSVLDAFAKKVPTYKDFLTRDFYLNGKKIFKYTTKYINFNNEEMILIIVDDITELETQRLKLVEQNKKLESLNKQKNYFLGTAAHDLRNPIGAIKSFSELILKSFDDFTLEERIEFMQHIYEASNFSLNLIDDLLDISVIESGQLNLNREKLDYIQLLKNNIAINIIFARDKNMNIKIENDIDELALNIDKSKIEQVLNNLISNAVKYSYPGTTITIKTKTSEKEIITYVIDEGQGISEEDRKKLFRIFERAKSVTTAGEKSTGLGLPIVKSIIKGHKGKIGVESQPGKGSSFYFSLPLT